MLYDRHVLIVNSFLRSFFPRPSSTALLLSLGVLLVAVQRVVYVFHVLVLLREVPHLQVRVRDRLEPAHFLNDLEALEERGRGEEYRPEDYLMVGLVVG